MSEMLGANGKFYADEFISMAFSRETLRALRPAAKQRDVSVAVLVRDIVAAVAADALRIPCWTTATTGPARSVENVF